MVSWSSVLWERSTERQVWQVVFYGLDIWKRSPKRQTDIFFTTVEVCALVPVCRVICFYTPVVLIPPGAAWGKAVNQGNMSDMMSSKVFGFSVYSVCVCVCVWTVSPFQAVFWSGTSYALVKTVGSWVGSREWGQIWSSTCLRRTKKNENHWLMFKIKIKPFNWCCSRTGPYLCGWGFLDKRLEWKLRGY